MPKEIIFEELTKEEKVLILRAFEYDVDSKGNVMNPGGSKIPSKETPNTFLNLDNIALFPGSLNVVESTPASISKFIREKLES